MTDLVERLRAALDETERVARAVTAEGWHEDVAKSEGWNEYNEGVREHIALHDPERELRMVAAHRKILDLFAGTVEVRDIAWDKYRAGKMPNEAESRDAAHAERELAALQVVVEALAEAYGVEVTA